MTEKRKRTLLEYVSPLGPFRRAADSLSSTRKNLGVALAKVKEMIPDRDPNEVFPPDDARSIDDPSARFEVMYEINEWTQAELDLQIKACSRTKLVAIGVSLVSLIVVLVALFLAPLWLLFMIMPIGGSLVILGLAQSFKFALFEAQLRGRKLISAKDFYSMPDFWTKYLG